MASPYAGAPTLKYGYVNIETPSPVQTVNNYIYNRFIRALGNNSIKFGKKLLQRK